MRLAALYFIACLFFSMSLIAHAQQETRPRREGVITGRILADGRPVGGALVIAQSAGGKIGDLQTVVSDDDGNFRVTGLSPGAYFLMTQIPGYVMPSDSSSPLRRRIGENVSINLIKGAVITGRVTDEFGEPIVGARVVAYRARTLEGKIEFDSKALNVASAGRETDDRGIYRIFGLEPGVYVVSLNGLALSVPGFTQSRREPPVYHPSSSRNSATEVIAPSGGEASGVDIRYRLLRGHSVSGVVTGDTEGGSVINAVAVMMLRAADRQPVAMEALITERNFSLRGVEDGEYDLVATRINEGFEFSTSAPRRLTVKGADVSGIELKLFKLGSIEGDVVIESKQGDACKSGDDFSIGEILLDAKRDEKTPGLFTSLASIETRVGMGSAAPGDDGSFVLKNLEPGRARIVTDLPGENWRVRAITQKSTGAAKPVDASQNGLAVKSGEKITGVEVTIAEDAASLNGKVVPANVGSKSPKRFRVHLIPAEPAAVNETLRYHEKIANNNGSFEFKNLAPGRYLLHLRAAEESDSADNPDRPVAWDAIERAKLRREAEASKKEIELKPCQRVKDHVLRW